MAVIENGRAASAVTVSALNEYIKKTIEGVPMLADIYVKGEISNFKNHAGTGHYYFTLKDESSVIRAVMFRSSAAKLRFMPENGLKVTLHGRVGAFVRDGQYQIYADAMAPDGVGELHVAFEQIKRRLEAEGLFSPQRKRPIPKIPMRIGVITSPTGAAVRDIINVCGRRYPAAELIVYPALVQGAEAVPSLIAGMEYFISTRRADVIIIGRGGGSIEDLWAFNSEELARVIARCPIPVISAVGHETDFTICDFVADKRAPTPSAAAELATPNTDELKLKIENLISRERNVLLRRLDAYRKQLDALATSRSLTKPLAPIEDRRLILDHLSDKLLRAENVKLERGRSQLARCAAQLDAMNPLSVLARGYSAVYSENGTIIKSIHDVDVGASMTVRVADGKIAATVSGSRSLEQAQREA